MHSSAQIAVIFLVAVVLISGCVQYTQNPAAEEKQPAVSPPPSEAPRISDVKDTMAVAKDLQDVLSPAK